MAGGSQLPVSALIKRGNQLDELEGKRRSKDEYRKQKDLEEQRKAGQAPAMVDVETGRDINPHIPEFIEKTPWYVPASGPTLKHQRPHPEREQRLATIKDFYPKGTTDNVAFKYRKGACENCGAMGHNKKDCFERPRSVGAKFTNQVIAADDYVLPSLKMSFDAKRDRWNGYDPAEYKKVHEEYEQMEETRKLIRAQNMKDGIETPDAEADEVRDNNADEDMYAEDMAPAMSVDMDSRTRITVRNLRIREDTAKYLYSLDDNSAYYDPKSRSMRENPFENVPGKEKEAAKFSGENFVRYTGEVVEANEAQVFAWQARCQGIDVHALAEPTKLEALKRFYEVSKKEHKGAVTQELIDKYGGQEHLDAPQKELLLAQTENYVEYNRKGNVIRGEERSTVKSRYDENVYPQNHTSVWGSYWRDGQWGYKCCHSFFKNSYCIGEKGLDMEKAVQQSTSAIVDTSINKASQSSFKEESKSSELANLKLESADKKLTAEKDQLNEESDELEQKSKQKRHKRRASNSVSSSSSDSESTSGNSEENEEKSDIEVIDEEEMEKERQKKLKKESRLKTRREKRKRQKERRKQRPKKPAKNKRKEKKRHKKRDEGRNRRDSLSSSFSSSSSSSSSSSRSASEDEGKGTKKETSYKLSKELSEAMRKVREKEEEGRRIAEMGDRKRKYNSYDHVENKPSEIEMEAYQRTRIHSTDPMASLMEKKSRKQQ